MGSLLENAASLNQPRGRAKDTIRGRNVIPWEPYGFVTCSENTAQRAETLGFT
jgi:hypothetical protein